MFDPACERVLRLGAFLTELTSDRPADRVHAEILERLGNGAQDHRLAGIYSGVEEFAAVWTAIRSGASLPATSWETVILPAVVHYSPVTAFKTNLQTATGLWLAATCSPPEQRSTIDPIPWREPEPIELPAPMPPRVDRPQPAMPPTRLARRWIPLAAGLAVAVVAVLAITGGTTGTGRIFSRTSPPSVGDMATLAPALVSPSPTVLPAPSLTAPPQQPGSTPPVPPSTPPVEPDDPPVLAVPSSVPHRASFQVSGGGWPCTKVNIYVGTHLIAHPQVGADGAFPPETIKVDPDGRAVDLADGKKFALSPGTWQIKGRCGATESRPYTMTVKANRDG